MKIQYLGHASFRLISEMGNAVVTDPFDGAVTGYPMPRVSCDVATVSHHHRDHDFVEALRGDPCELDCEVTCCSDDIAISSFTAFHDEAQGKKRGKTLVFCFSVDGLRVVHMGDIGELNADVAAKIFGCDVLMVPVGGNYTVDAAGAKWYVDEVKPKIVLPMHYKTADGTLDIAPLKPFTDLFDASQVHYVDGETLMLDDLAETTAQVFVLQKYED